MMLNDDPDFSRMEIEEVENGYIVCCGANNGLLRHRFVFPSLAALAEWLIEIEAK